MVALKADPYGAVRSRAIRCHEKTYGASESPYVAHRSVSRMGSDREPTRPPTAVYEPSVVPKSYEARIGKLCKLNFQVRALWRPNGSKNLRKILRARTACHGITHRFSSFRPVGGPWTARELHVTEEFG